MAEVEVRGAGLAGTLLAARLRAEGVEVRLVDPAGGWTGASGAALGVALPVPAEHPWRFEAALGTARAAELCAWAAAGLRTLPGYTRTGVDWACPGAEAPDAARSLDACARLGVAATAIPEGFRLLDGGPVDLVTVRGLAGPVDREPGPAEIEVLACGAAAVDPWLADKLTPVRWQRATFPGPALDRPRVSRHASVIADGGLTLAGARWATPHLEVGETDPVPSPRVAARLAEIARLDHGVDAPPNGARAGIVAESCDGLPVVGAIPGRPRTLVLAGLGAFGLTWVGAAVDALVAAILGRPSWLPRALDAGRFR